ncbi:MAG: hypothetical protein LBR90_03265 [Elusimicrobiota bacterium]|jgi:hypothetical protein|nr:hypothetical protein [Elusimicrobiota bacterium]
MTDKTLAVFEGFEVRRHYDEKADKWYFSIIDIIAVLTQQADYNKTRNYWKWLKNKLTEEGSQLVSHTNQLKMQAADGKYYATDAADVEQLLRLVQSVPSPKAEPVKQWLAKVGYERMQESADPELSLNRARENWKAHGRSQKWIQQRMSGQETRNKLTDYWQTHGVKEGGEFAILTDIIHKEWSGLSIKNHKNLKGLKTQNLRDHMSEAELLFTALAELTTRQIAENVKAKGLSQNKKAGKEGGKLAKGARLAFEKKTGSRVVTGANYLGAAQKKKLK